MASYAWFDRLASEAHIWLLDPRRIPPLLEHRFHDSLSGEELDRLGRFRFEDDRQAYLASHGMVRSVLSRYASRVEPGAWRFTTNYYGRPEIAAPYPCRMLRFNLSHTRRLVACIVARESECGIDVQSVVHESCREAALGVLAPTEMLDLASALPDERRRCLSEYWALKEAYAKARGIGLSLPVHHVGFDLRGLEITALMGPEVQDSAPSAWRFSCTWPTPDHVMAVALRPKTPSRLRLVLHDLGGVTAGDTPHVN